MMSRKEMLHLTGLTLCLLIGMACGEDWLGGGYVEPYSGDIAKYFTDPIFSPNQRLTWERIYYPYFGAEFFRDYAYPYQFRNGTYTGPYGIYPYYSSPFYSDFRLNSLVTMTWEPFQKNWEKTLDYAQTKSSVRVYPKPTSSYPIIQIPASIAATQSSAPATGDSTATIVSQGMKGYQVFLDGNYIGTEGTGGDLLDGKFSFSVVGGRSHNIRVYDGQFNYPKTMFFERGGTKIIHVEPGTEVYI